MKSEICVIGGGPAGLAAALALSRSGRAVTLLDSAIPPIDKACGEGLLPDSVSALRKLGVTLPEAGADLLGIRFASATSEVTARFPNDTGRGLRRVLLHQQLVSAAQRQGIRQLWGVKNVQTERGRVSFDGGQIETSLIVGADGQKSSVRRQAGLHRVKSETFRYGFRRHYAVAPWSPYVEVHWGDRFQIYITPVAANQVCVALLSMDRHLRLDAALERMDTLSCQLDGALPITQQMGGMSVSRQLHQVLCDGYVLVGDASGSVDAITGEGMCLAFLQSAALVEALNGGDLHIYQEAHNKIMAKPRRISALLLLMGSNPLLSRTVLAGLAAYPDLFSSLLAMHVGNESLSRVFSRHLLSFGSGDLCG